MLTISAMTVRFSLLYFYVLLLKCVSMEKTGKMTPSRHFKKTTLRQDFGTTPFSVKTKNSSFAVNSITNL